VDVIKEVCRKIKEKRKELGYSIEYVVEKTKLYPSVIRHIEEGELENINSTYLKGFIKIYALFLKVELGTALEEITTSKSSIIKRHKKTKKAEGRSIINSMIEAARRISPEIKKKAVIIFLGAILLWGVFAVSRFVVVKISGVFRRGIEKQEEARPPASFTIDKGEEIVVSLTAKRKCFLRAVVDGKLLFEGVLDKGVIEVWRGNREIEFKISDGSAIYLEVNGISVPALSSMRKPIKSLKITPSGISVDK